MKENENNLIITAREIIQNLERIKSMPPVLKSQHVADLLIAELFLESK